VNGKSRDVSGTATPAINEGELAVASGRGEMGDAADLAHQEARDASAVTAEARESGGNSTGVSAATPGGAEENAKVDTEKKEKPKMEDQSGKILTIMTNDIQQLQWGAYFIAPCMSPRFSLSHLTSISNSLLRRSNRALHCLSLSYLGLEVYLFSSG
jgi:hypothetical protein